VTATLRNMSAPALSDVAVTWTRYASENDAGDQEAVVQAPSEVTALFSGARQVLYGFVEDCTSATLTATIDGYEVSTRVSTSELSITKGKVSAQ
jgi:poly [ADP-ribose] polymerase